MTTLAPKPGFDWSRVKWGGPTDPLSFVCSYCDAAIDDEACPLRMMGETQFAVFCDPCAERWFGLQRSVEP